MVNNSLLDLHNGIRTEFLNLVQTPLSPLIVMYDNSPQADGPTTDNTEWVRFTILDGDSVQSEFGNPDCINYRSVGVCIATIFTPISIGDARALTIADTIFNSFLSLSIESVGVTFRTPSIEILGREGQFYQVNVKLPFLRRFTK